MRKFLGWSLIATPLLLIFMSDIMKRGIIMALVTWAAAIVLCGMVFLGLYLVIPKE